MSSGSKHKLNFACSLRCNNVLNVVPSYSVRHEIFIFNIVDSAQLPGEIKQIVFFPAPNELDAYFFPSSNAAHYSTGQHWGTQIVSAARSIQLAWDGMLKFVSIAIFVFFQHETVMQREFLVLFRQTQSASIRSEMWTQITTSMLTRRHEWLTSQQHVQSHSRWIGRDAQSCRAS